MKSISSKKWLSKNADATAVFLINAVTWNAVIMTWSKKTWQNNVLKHVRPMLHQFPNCYCPLTGFYYHSLRKKCPYSEFFWRVFSRIRNEYGEITSISPYSVQMRENTDQKNSEYGHFSHSEYDTGLMWVDIRKIFYSQMTTLHKTYENTGFYWTVFSRIKTES